MRLMECPYCKTELEHHDEFGTNITNSNYKKSGDIYKCPNEECESDSFNRLFYTRGNDDELREGMPC